ncbi:lysophospholipid acyltransferase family protein [Falsirhodobacter xinxiangensis]|uniref:lysophospholipid acyltransferase family protein n=1 Tax=Falsirhodobacter xinxiangensis TaxID=2530049 RepID=UPI0010AA57FE|nr:lysophospholipid acyltransferase family protein [Rhodobacter xinxiangensis]
MIRRIHPLQWLLSLVFILQMYLAMAVLAVVFAPIAIVRREAAMAACQNFCRWVRFSLRVICGLRTEVRGTPPTGAALVPAKHQSFLDILLIFGAMEQPRFIMKQELVYAPILGWYALRVGCVPVSRGKRGEAIKRMMDRVREGAERPGQLVIYPQGTRVAPGAKLPYKVGAALLYAQMGGTCVPVAANVGLFWPRHGIYRKPGTAVVEFLPPIEPGLPQDIFMERLERSIETASDRLIAEAR